MYNWPFVRRTHWWQWIPLTKSQKYGNCVHVMIYRSNVLYMITLHWGSCWWKCQCSISHRKANGVIPSRKLSEATSMSAMFRWDHIEHKQRFLTPGHQGWNDLHSLCRIGMECYLLNNDDNNIIYWIMMIIMIMMMMIIIIMMTIMIIGTATIMMMIIIITTTLTMTIMKMIMIKTAQTPCQSLYKDRHI